jgi:hypothetical protein
LEKVAALHILHGNELQAAAFAKVVNPKDIGMCDPAGELQLLLESLQSERILARILAEDLQRDSAIEFLVVSSIDSAHTPHTENALNVITRAKVLVERE